MGVSESWLSNKQEKQMLLHEKDYFTLFKNDTEHPEGIGVGLIIKKNYAQYIY
jgi:hypothetical protein